MPSNDTADWVGSMLHTTAKVDTSKKPQDKAGKDDKGGSGNDNVALHHDKAVRKALHHHLAKIHKAVFSPETKDLESAKEKHKAILDMTKPDDEDEGTDDGKKPVKK